MPPGTISIPPKFAVKKESILSQLALDPADYDDKSPKGSVDIQILDLIRLINDVEGWVTTSSCAGRAAVFVEGPKREFPVASTRMPQGSDSRDDPQDDMNGIATTNDPADYSPKIEETRTAPGGKGGGHWLYVSHEPLQLPDPVGRDQPSEWIQVFDLRRHTGPVVMEPVAQMIHLTYSPLILHILCATLQHARPLLAAAINAGFRESGVQSLKALDPDFSGDGVMVAIRTNGIVFDSIVGWSDPKTSQNEAIVDELYLGTCANIINERFQWNEVRKQRLVRELEAAIKREGWRSADRNETRDERRERKRKEGLEAQKQKCRAVSKETSSNNSTIEDYDISSLSIR